MSNQYGYFLNSPTARQWKKIGIEKRAGVAVPLFSLFSEASVGVGEFPDLKLLADWCVKTGMSIIQLLPLNDTGFKYTPYDAESTIALDPIHIALRNVAISKKKKFEKEIANLAKKYPAGKKKVDYRVKGAKLEILWKMFESETDYPKAFQNYCEREKEWLDGYALFKIFKEKNRQAGWMDWPDGEKNRSPETLAWASKEYSKQILFQKWIQWQLFEQLIQVKKYAESKKIYLMGDLPFLVSRDSADVWARQHYFKLDLSAGAPPDLFFSSGQRWGMPPYRWEEIEKNGYDYLRSKLKYAENFYDFSRIDHAVGLFRIWTISNQEPQEHAGLHGKFDPENEQVWAEHGKKIIRAMLEHSGMLPCAEDLGVVPPCSDETLSEFGIPGMDIQRWKRDWGKTYRFSEPESYRTNSAAVISTHDMTSFKGWWLYEAGTFDANLIQRQCRAHAVDFEAVKGRLFDLENSSSERFRWHPDLKDVTALLSVLQKAEHDARFFVDAFLGTFNEREKFLEFVGMNDPKILKSKPSGKIFAELIKRAILKAHQSASIFSIQLFQDWLSVDPKFGGDKREFRINVPGTMGDHNWTLVMPLSLEKLNRLDINRNIFDLNKAAGRS